MYLKKVVLEDLKDLKIKKKEEPDFVKSGIRKLTKRKDDVIWPTDKGGGIVILSKEQYNESMLKMITPIVDF